MSTNKKKLYSVLIVTFLLAILLLNLSFLHSRMLAGSDQHVYIEGAKSIALGQGYCIGGKPHTAWPPGFSTVLAPVFRVFGESIVAFKTVNVFLAVSALVVLLALLSRITSKFRALFMTLAMGTFFPWLYYTQFIGSDILFSLLVWVFLWGAVKKYQTQKIWPWVFAAIAVMLCPLVRMAGVACILAYMLTFSIFDKVLYAEIQTNKWRKLALRGGLLAISIAPTVLWAFRNVQLSGHWTGVRTDMTPEYIASISQIGVVDPSLPMRVWINVMGYVHILVIPSQADLVAVFNAPLLLHIICGLISLVVVIGWLVSFKTEAKRPLTIIFALYGGMLLVHNWFDIRYLLPILPIYLLFLFDGAEWLALILNKGVRSAIGYHIPSIWIRNAITTGLIAFAVLNFAFATASPHAKKLRTSTASSFELTVRDACIAINKSELKRAILGSIGGGWIQEETGREYVRILDFVNKETGELNSLEIPANIDFILLTNEKFANYRGLYMEPLLEANKSKFKIIYEKDDIVVYERVSP